MEERVREIEIILKTKTKPKRASSGEKILLCISYAPRSIFGAVLGESVSRLPSTLMGAEQLNGWKKATTEIQIMFYKRQQMQGTADDAEHAAELGRSPGTAVNQGGCTQVGGVTAIYIGCGFSHIKAEAEQGLQPWVLLPAPPSPSHCSLSQLI